MQGTDELLTVAELAIGLAGFSAVVVSFTHRGGLRKVDRLLFVQLLAVAGGAVLLSFVPFLFDHAGLAGPSLWVGSSIVMLVLTIVLSALLGIPTYRLGLFASMPLGRASVIAHCSVPLLNFASQIANVVGWPLDSGPLLYMVGLLLWLAIAGMLFATLVLLGARE